MKRLFPLLKIISVVAIAVLADSCKKNPSGPSVEPRQVSGAVQKGPFITGTSVTIHPLDAQLAPTGESYETQISDDLGNFMFPVKISAPYAELTAQGYYFNEILGRLSDSPITLRSIIKLNDGDHNINLLTTLEAGRLRYLIEKGGKHFEDARKTAQNGVLASFGITLIETMVSDQLDISRAGEANAALLAVSCILQGYGSEAELSERTAKIANDIRDNGQITKTELLQEIQNNRKQIDAEYVSKNLRERYAELGIADVQVPDIYGYLDSDGDGTLNGAKPYLLVPEFRKDQRLTYERDTMEITVHSNVKWVAEVPAEAAEWLSIDGRTTNDLLVLVAQSNEGSPRAAQLILKEENGTLADTVNITQFGKYIQLTANIQIANSLTNATTALDPALKSEVKSLVLIGFDQNGQMLFNRAVAELAFDTVNVSIETPFLEMNPYCRIYAIANDFDTYSRFRGQVEEFKAIRTHRDVNDPGQPVPRTDFKDVKLDYNRINTVDIALVHRTARLEFDVQFDPESISPVWEVVDFTAKEIRSRSGLFFWPDRDTDPAYTNDITVTRGADNRYTFHVYGYTGMNRVEITVRDNDGITKSHTAKFQNFEFLPGRLYRYTVTIPGDKNQADYTNRR